MSQFSDAVLALSPKGYYRLDETTGTVAADASSNGRNGSYSGAALGGSSLVPSDTAGHSVTLNNAYVSTPAAAALASGNTVVLSYKGTGTGGGYMTMVTSGSGSACGLYCSAAGNGVLGNVMLQHGGAGVAASDTGYAASGFCDGQEHLIIATFAPGAQKLYVDGVLVGSASQSGTPGTGTPALGRYSSSHYFSGQYDDWAILPTVLSDAQVASLYDAWTGATQQNHLTVNAGVDLALSGSLVLPDSWDTTTMLGADGLHPNDLGEAYLNKVYRKALADAGKTPPRGSLLYAYGDSYTASDYENTPEMRAILQFSRDLDLTLTNQAISGYKIGDAAGRAIGTAGAYPPAAADLVFVQIGVNDLQQTDTAQQRTAIENYLRALLAALCAAERIEDTAYTSYGSTWTGNSLTTSSGGHNYQTSAEGNYLTFDIGTPGTYYMLVHGTDGTTVGGTFTASQGGVDIATVDTNAQALPTGNTLTSFYGNLALRLDNVQAGQLKVTYSNASRAGATGYFDALVRIDPSPQTILMVKPVEVTKATYQNPTLLDFIRTTYDGVAAEFGPSIVVADPVGTPGSPTGSPTEWWDGAQLQPASLLGWWDGAQLQPASLLGWWDGTALQPLI